ncbi:MAG TPA: hypothetical protein VF194_19655 [Ferrovibrio sp.]|uniref:hypothetical protein n=1 Tax=Ferrovibrio sp. TaxID=1917215 RepID=UPI002ED33971
MSFLGGLFGGSQSTTVQNSSTIYFTPEVTINNDDSRLQQLVDTMAANGSAQTEAVQQQVLVTALQAQATLEAAKAQQTSAETTANALSAGLTRAAIIGALATLAVNIGPKLLKA